MSDIAIDPSLASVAQAFCRAQAITSETPNLRIVAGAYVEHAGPAVTFFGHPSQPAYVVRVLSIAVDDPERTTTAWRNPDASEGDEAAAYRFGAERFGTEALLLAMGEGATPSIHEVRLVTGETYVLARVSEGEAAEGGYATVDVLTHLRVTDGGLERSCISEVRLPPQSRRRCDLCFFRATDGVPGQGTVEMGQHTLVELHPDGGGVYQADDTDAPYDAEANAPPSVVDETLRLPRFPDALRVQVGPALAESTTDSAYTSAVGFMERSLVGRLAVADLDTAAQALIEALEPYVDMAALDAALPGREGLTRLAEAVYQFQRKAFADTDEHDGWPGTKVLSSVGFAPLYSADDAREELSSTEKIAAMAGVDLDRACVRHFERELRRGKRGFKQIRGGDWFRYIADPVFLGQVFKSPVHAVLVRQLRVAEQELYGAFWAEDPSLTPAVIGRDRLGIDGKHSGERKGTGMHGLGLALDLDVSENPWVGTEDPERWDEALQADGYYTEGDLDVRPLPSSADRREAALRHLGVDGVDALAKDELGQDESEHFDGHDHTPLAAQVFNGGTIALSERQWEQVWAYLFRRSRIIANHRFERITTAVIEALLPALREGTSEVVEAVRSRGIPVELAEVLEDFEGYRENVGALFHALGSTRPTARAYATLMVLSEAIKRKAGESGLDPLMELSGTRHYHDFRPPREIGFVTHDRRVVLAMRDTARLAWGAVDFGPRASGDVMHFDTRLLPYTQLIRDADVTGGYVNEGHPRWESLRCRPDAEYPDDAVGGGGDGGDGGGGDGSDGGGSDDGGPISIDPSIAGATSLAISRPADHTVWALLHEPEDPAFLTQGITQAGGAWTSTTGNGNLHSTPGTLANTGDRTGAAGVKVRADERGLVVRGAVPSGATGVQVEVLDASGTAIPLKANPSASTTSTSRAATLGPVSGSMRGYEAVLFLDDPSARLGPVRVRTSSVGLTPAQSATSNVLLAGVQVALVDDRGTADDGTRRGPLRTEADEEFVADFLASPQASRQTISDQTRVRRMIAYEIGYRTRALSSTIATAVQKPEMPMWMAELQLVGVDAAAVAAFLAARATAGGSSDLTIEAEWSLSTAWDGPNSGSATRPYRYSHDWTATTSARLALDAARTGIDGKNAAGEVPGAITPTPAFPSFPVAGRRRATTVVDGVTRRWGRRSTATARPSVLVEHQPVLVDGGGTEIMRGGDGELKVTRLRIDGTDVDPGRLATPSGTTAPPAAAPLAMVPTFRVKGTNPPEADRRPLVEAVVAEYVANHSTDAWVAMLPLAVWQDTAWEIVDHESIGGQHFEGRETGRRRYSGQYFGHELDMPMFGAPAGYGWGQMDNPPVTDDAAWSFVENVRAAVDLLIGSKASGAYRTMSSHFSTPPSRRDKAVLRREAVRRYNGGGEFRWNGSDWEIHPSVNQLDSDGHANARLNYPNRVLGTTITYWTGSDTSPTFPWPIAFPDTQYGPGI